MLWEVLLKFGKHILFLFLQLIVFLGFQPHALAWGPRGHQVVCEAAVFLVENADLQEFLRPRIPTMSYLCNVPDAVWKAKGPEITSVGNPTHYINPEVIGVPLREFPLDFQKLREGFEGKPDHSRADRKIFSLAKDMGTLFWRTDQFVRFAIESGKRVSGTTPPSNRKEQQQYDLPYNKAIYEMVLYMGILGHFVGDAGQPIHSTADYDGYSQGHGGIHAFYEEDVVSAQNENLIADVVKAGRKLIADSDRPSKNKKEKRKTVREKKSEKFKAKMPETQFLRLTDILEKIRALSAVSADDIGLIYQKDPITEKSTIRLDRGMEIKQAAKRKPTPANFTAYQSLVVKHLARAATLLADYWDHIYEQSGHPNLTHYRSYQFPYQPEFIPPDYLAPTAK